MGDLRSVMQHTYDKHGALTPAAVVADATKPDHPLHHRFEWDDKIAGHKYRLVQAGDLIRKVKIRYAETPEGEDKLVRGFVAIRREDDDDHGIRSAYEPTEKILENPLTRRILLREMDREWKRFKSRFAHMREFADLISDEADHLEEAS